MATKAPWYVVVDRADLDYTKRLRSYALGPFNSERKAEVEAEREDGTVFCWLTIDAKNEGYVADDCYRTQTPPKDSVFIIPPELNFDKSAKIIHEYIKPLTYVEQKD